MKRSTVVFSFSGKVSWTLSAFLPAESLTPTPSGISTLNQIKSVFSATGAFSLPSLLAALLPPPPPDALPPHPMRANAAKRAMQRERIDRVFFFMVASSLSVGDIAVPHAAGALFSFVADVFVRGLYECVNTSVRGLWSLRSRAPTGSLLIDMPQFVLPGSLERWAMCPMFALPPPIACHRNPRWPGTLTLVCLWARLSTIM